MRPLPILLKVLLGGVLVLLCAGLATGVTARSGIWTSDGPEDADAPLSLVFLPLLTIHTPSICDAVTGISSRECAALVELYNSTNGPGWTFNDDWLITNTPCSWYGVTCQTNHVHRIVMSSNALSGTIPVMLGDLENLRALQLDHNQLNGPLPDSLRRLNLYRFHFDHTNLCEPSSTEFQTWLAGIPDLRRTGETCHAFTKITTGAIVNDGGYSSGACWGDYDNDGYDDVFVANWSGENNFLYHNDGDGAFTRISDGSIVNDGGSSRSCTWGDYDNDGFLDLFVSNDGGGNFLYHNEDGTAFTRVLSGPIASDAGACYGASWADYDNDGWLDLFVARHTNANNLLYHNRGDGTFDKVEDGAITNDGGYSVSASWGDYNGDGCVDLVVANTNDQANFLYRNNCDGSFTKITEGPVVTDIGSSGTSNWVDFDNDGDLDLFIGNSGENQDNVLYRNDGGDTFTAIRTGVIVTDGDGHNSSWGDYDNDGDLDLFAGLAPLVQRLYQNNGDGTFTRLTNGAVVQDSGASGGLWGDYDNDGDLDLFAAVDRGGNNHLYRNDGNENHWLHLKLVGAASDQTQTGVGSNQSAIGARITAMATIGGRAVVQVQEVAGQTGMYNQNSLDVEFGLGDAIAVDTLTVRWPSGVVQTLTDVAANRFLTIQESPAPLLVKYDFEDDFLTSGTVLDRSGNGHDAQVMGEVAAAGGISGGQGISFDGNGYVQAASNPAAGKADITFSMWFKTDQPGENYKLASAAWWNWDLRASGWIIGTHIPEFWSDDEAGLYLPGIVNNDNGFQAGAWNHEVITYDGSRIKEYTNGQLINDWPTTGAAIGAGLPMAVGAWPMFSGYNFQGSLDEFMIYDRSLTQQEVQALYAQGR